MPNDQRTQELASLLSSLSAGAGIEAIAEIQTESLMAPQPGLQGAETPEEAHAAREAARKVVRGEEISNHDAFLIEAIIIPDKRPATLVIDDDYTVQHQDWLHFNTDQGIRKALRTAIPAVGRIELPRLPQVPFGGTGFVVGEGLVMTNRHVAELFARGLGTQGLGFIPGQTADIDFEREVDRGGANLFDVEEIVMVHPYWDMAILRVPALAGRITPLTLSTAEPEEMEGSEIAAIGFPAFDWRNDAAVQNRVFNNIYDVKRMQPGKLKAREPIPSFDRIVRAVTHDASTLGGNSGSAVLHVGSGTVAALHFAGRYRIANYAVPSFEMSRDERILEAGVNFGSDGRQNLDGPPPWQHAWDELSLADEWTGGPGKAAGGDGGGDHVGLQAPAGGGGSDDGSAVYRWTIPIEVSVRLGAPQPGQAAARPAARATTGSAVGAPAIVTDLVERAVEPTSDPDYTTRQGYLPDFLGFRVPMPTVIPEARDQLAPLLRDGSHELKYHNFSIIMHAKRRLALITAANIDASEAARRPEPGRGYGRRDLNGFTSRNDREKWFPDRRISADHQLSDRFYNKDRQAFNKGHIVRRAAVAFGPSYRAVQFANGDTFHITNCSPQVADFNQSRLDGLWGDLENHVFDQAKTEKLCVLAGPVLADDDPTFLGVDDDGQIRVKVPQAFWKLVVARKGDDLEAFAFVLKQDLGDVDFGEFVVTAAWASHQVSVADLEKTLGIVRFDDAIHAGDRHTA